MRIIGITILALVAGYRFDLPSVRCALDGTLDEVRIASVERTAGWIATEYANQSSPQTFYAVGAEAPVR